ncbi:autotransporter domain-containing protein [Luteibacter sp. UNCMF366Tsu5.1]|uniref:autotransporter domain-containing protein n=1 Tax=Luteibacter sp. UNCMF366Tsu5.1 TaxID=1502758 RepID=UPI00090872D2|nr:autotransporter domain-containing protein [Luteibacter sp. UNCMF366Tsu5.1]SFW55754.1 outer membrane autotransporter barrel domain-containing protein [Luteibacter sp. UNCMF366Tsu5.1]
MNRVYHLVWNGALRVVQVASELSSSRAQVARDERGGMPRLRALSLAFLAAGLGLSSSVVSAAQCTPLDLRPCSAAGGTPSVVQTYDRLGQGGFGNGNGGNAIAIPLAQIAGGLSVNGNGGAGANGQDFPNDGAGGTGGNSGTNGTLTGQNGGDGGFGARAGGGGGGGGAGVYSTSTSISISSGVNMAGGNGGNGGDGQSNTGSGPGGGGGGGTGLILAADGTVLVTAGTLKGGAGGRGGTGGGTGTTIGAGGGGGGDGLLALGNGTQVTNSGTITGGVGGAEGTGGAGPFDAGQSGAGVTLAGANSRLINSGSIFGGAAVGPTGAAGAGVITYGGGTLIQNGSLIQGGLAADGVSRASAIIFNGTLNQLLMLPGATLNGAVQVNDGGVVTISSNIPANGGAQSLIGDVRLQGASNGASVAFATGQFDAAGINVTGSIQGTGNVTSSGGAPLSLHAVNVDGTLNLQNSNVIGLAGNITTTGQQTYGAPIQLNSAVTMQSQAAIDIVAPVIGTFALSIVTPNDITLGADVGFSNMLTSFSANGNHVVAQDSIRAGSISITTHGGPIEQSGAFVGASANAFDAGTNDITLINAGNDFGSGVSLVGGNIAVNSATDLTVSNVSYAANGNVSLSSGGRVVLPFDVITSGAVSLTSRGGTFATGGQVSGSTVALQGDTGITLNHDVTSTGTLNIDSAHGSLNQIAGAVTAATFTANVAGNITLTSAGNAIGAIGNVTAADFTLANTLATTVTGNVNVSSADLISPQGTVITGTLRTDVVTRIGTGTSLAVGNGGTSGTLTSDVINNGTLVFNRSDVASFTEALAGSGHFIKAGTGTLLFDGDAAPYTGDTTVQSGQLIVGSVAGSPAQLNGNVSVDSGAGLGGHGLIVGDVSLAGGASLSPGHSIGTLTVDGDLAMADGSTYDAELGASGAGDKVVVTGALSLGDVTLNVSDAGGMGPGVYTLFSYGTTLTTTNGGLHVGSAPSGRLVQLQYLTGARQINLIDYTGATLNFWNANGLATTTQMGGGSGTWSATSNTWTDAQASITAPMTPQPGFAVFGGAPGTVTADASAGALAVTGMQFLSDGYRVTGDSLNLVESGGPVILRVGDGTSVGRAYVAAIDSVLSGTQGFTKQDAGTLVLNGANTFSGGLTINGGTVSVRNDANLGDAANVVTMIGGELRITGTSYTSTDRTLSLLPGGGIGIDDAANVFTWGGAITGPGSWQKTGAGTLVLEHANSYGGITWLSDGTLRLGDSGAIGTGNLVMSGGTLAFGADGLSLANAVRLVGEGSIDVQAGNTATLSGRIDDSAIPGTIGAPVAGSFTKTGAGTLVLTGTVANTGLTTIADGTLHVGDGGTRGTLPLNIANHGSLVLDRSDDVDYAGTMSGDGAFHKLGSHALRLTGDSSAFAGTSSIAGTLQLDGALGGSLAFANGAVLTGTGKAGSASFAAGSELSPAGRGTVGSLSFTGDLTLAAGMRYTVDVTDAGTSDSVTVGGRASLQGGSVVSLGSGAQWQANTTYRILTAVGGVGGTFSNVSSDLAFLTPSLVYTSNAVDLTLARNDRTFPDVAVTRNQRATAAAAESLGSGPVYDAILRMDSATAVRAFDNLSGEIRANLRGALVDDDRYQRDAINQHLLVQQADGADDASGAWASVWGHWGNHDGDGNAARLSANGSGLLVGADAGIGSDTRLGVALGSGHVSASARGDSASGDTRTAALYGSGHYGNVLLQAGALYSYRDIDTHRTVDVDTLGGRVAGSQHARSAQVFVEGAYELRFDRASLAPFVNVARQQLRTDHLHEQPGPAALDVMGETSAQTFGTLGLRGNWTLSDEGGIAAFGSVGWQHAWGDTDTLSRQRFVAGGDTFHVAGTPIAENAGVATMGLRFKPAPSVTIDASYMGQFASHAKDQSARLSVNWAF